ncbi:MAG: Ni/Fe hydrogenase subunit alpha [Acidobacteria bacterium]|nr:Ni/Fe hydrogenase subunit alpha [Acidobacteriota bacterium]
MTQRITIDPITRLEGHGKIEIFLDDQGEVANAYLQIPELRGFERFCLGRAAEEMPRITQRICGVCPSAHHMASARALDALYHVDPPPAAHKLRELFYNLFTFEDHTLHFYFLGGPDFIVGPSAPAAERNVVGVIAKVGLEIGGKVIEARKKARHFMAEMAGKAIHPVFGLPGGVSKPMSQELVDQIREAAPGLVAFAQFSLQAFGDIVLKNQAYVDTILAGHYAHRTNYMGTVDPDGRVNFYRGQLRVIDPTGKQLCQFEPKDYLTYIAEHVEPWSYIKFPFLKQPGWKGFVDGADSGLYRVAPLARLNVADGMATPKAQEHYEQFFATLGGKPVHSTLATHWARLIEALQAAETVERLANDPEILDRTVRRLPDQPPTEGVGIVEAPRGTLIHHYATDPNGILTMVNLMVATVHNSAPIQMSIERAARGVIHGGKVDDGLLNQVEMAFRAYDPCFGCATHSLPGEMPLTAVIRNARGEVVREVRRAPRLSPLA